MVSGSIGAGVLLILALFPAVVSAQAINVNEKQTNIFQQMKEKIKNTDWKTEVKLFWFPGYLILSTILGLIILFLGLLSIGHPS